MKIYQKLKLILFIGMILLFLVINSNESLAASFSVKASKSTVKPGETYNVTITGSDVTGKFTISGNGNVTINSATSVWIENNSATVSVTAKSEGTGTITVKAENVANSTTGDDFDDFTRSKSCSVTIKKEETSPAQTTTTNNGNSSNNNNTSNEPTFKSVNQTMYVKNTVNFRKSYSTNSTVIKKLEVGTEVTRIGIGSNGWDKVKYNGTTGYIKNGFLTATKPVENTSNPTETSELVSTTPVEDTLAENTEPTQPPTENNVPEERKLALESISVENFELNQEFNPDIKEYKINIEDSNITKLNIQAKSNYEEAKINIIGNEELKEGENRIVIEVKLEESDKSVQYIIIANKAANPKDEEIRKLKKEIDNKNTTITILAIIAAISVVGNGALIIYSMKSKKDKGYY